MQKVVRTGSPESGYWSVSSRMYELQKLLESGYKVVMCNSIQRRDGEQWLEYILEKGSEQTTPQEAIETIKIAQAEVEWNYPMDYSIAFEGALKAIRKQIPKKPIRNDKCTCPNCGTHNEIIKKRRNTVAFDTVYCWHCGQAIGIKRNDEE